MSWSSSDAPGYSRNLVDEMFFNTNNSVWLPQNGFEQWSIFYLQRKGMAYERIIEFLKCFNGLVKEQLMNFGEAAPPVQLLDQIKALSQFHENGVTVRS
jgi:hypothetical protein